MAFSAGLAGGAMLLSVLVPPPPADDVHVVDTTGQLSADGLAAAESAADRWEAQTTNDVVVAVVPTLEGLTVEAYAAELFASWQPGLAGVDNGVVVVVALDDRELRVEAGRGLADVLTLERAGEVASAALPPLRDGDVDGAVLGLVEDVVDVVDRAGQGLPPSATVPPPDGGVDVGPGSGRSTGGDFPWWVVVIPGAMVLYTLIQRARGYEPTGSWWSSTDDDGSGYPSGRRRRFAGGSIAGGSISRGSSRRSGGAGRSSRSSSSGRRGGRSSGRGASRRW